MTDQEIGGFSEAMLDWHPRTSADPAHIRFHGTISTDLPPNDPNVHRSGFAAWRTWDRKRTLFGKSLWDVDSYRWLALRVKSDGRRYFVNLQTESIVPTDIHQHRLYTKKPGQWETILIDWNQFVRTNMGVVVEPQNDILRQKLRTVGIGLTDRIPGTFDLSISKIWATNLMDEQEIKALEQESRGLGAADQQEDLSSSGKRVGQEKILI
jgi:NADH dehydrogenase [ubiquinone] 1 alpha subcomplex assembly factor 1